MSDDAPSQEQAASGRWLRWLMPSLACASALWVVLAVLVGGRGPAMLSFDLPTHLAFGEQMLREGRLPPADGSLFSFPDKPYIDHEWGAQLALALAYRAGGLEGVVALGALLLAGALALLASRLRELGVGLPLAALTVACAFVSMRPHLLVRPHLASWLLGLIWVIRLERHTAGEISWRRWQLLAVPQMMLWANLHAGFLLAFYVLGLFGLASLWTACAGDGGGDAGDRRAAWRRFWGLVGGGVICLGATLVNPYGPELHRHFVHFLSDLGWLQTISEWRSPNFHDPTAAGPFWFVLIALGSLAIGSRPAPIAWLLVIGLLASSLKMVRNLPLLVLLCAPLVAARLQAWLDARAQDPVGALPALARGLRWLDAAGERERGAGGWPLALALTLLVLQAVVVGKRRPVRWPATRFPVEAAQVIRDHPELRAQRVFNTYGWGGYLSRELEMQVLINGLNDHYGRRLLADYRRVYGLAPGWEEQLAAWQIRWVCYHSDTPLTAMLDRHPGWRRLHRDPVATIFVRVD